MKNITELMSLKGRVALITGGAGHIGMAIAEALAEVGCNICLLDKPGDSLGQSVEKLMGKWGIKAAPIAIDLESEDERNSVFDSVSKIFGRLDILINNAAFVGDSKLQGWVVPFEEQHIDTWRRCMEVNLNAAFHLSQSLYPMLKVHGTGSIVNISSIYGVVGPDLSLYEDTPMGNPAAYAASKGGMLQLTRWMSTVVSPDVRVNAITPGGVFRNQLEKFVGRYEKKTPLGRMAKEEDFKGAALYLASDLSAYVTGQNLIVDGGWTAW